MLNKKIPRQADTGIPVAQPCASKSRFFKKFLAGTGIASLSLLTGCEGQNILPVASVTVAAVFAFIPAVAAGSYFYFEAKWKKEDAASPENYSKFIEQPKTKDFTAPPPLYFNSEVYARLDIPYYPSGHLSADLLQRVTPVPIPVQGEGAPFPEQKLRTYSFETGGHGDWEMAACMQLVVAKLTQIREKAAETGDSGTQKIVDDCFAELGQMARETRNPELQGTLSHLLKQLDGRGIEIGNWNSEGEGTGRLRWSTGGNTEGGYAENSRRTGSFPGNLPTREKLTLAGSKE